MHQLRPPWYVTTAIPYVNAPPHIGFAHEIIQTDVLARYHRLQGYDVRFLTGSDENGLKIGRAASERGLADATRCSGGSPMVSTTSVSAAAGNAPRAGESRSRVTRRR